jgi:hypothetical protein
MSTVKLPNVRLSFPALWEPAAPMDGQPGEPTYQATLILDPVDNAEGIKLLNAAILAAAKDKWPNNHEAVLAACKANGKSLLRDGNGKLDKQGQPSAGFAGKLFLNARNKIQPTIVGPDRAPLSKASGKPYGGCFINVILDIWAQDNSFGKRVNASLTGVQFKADGPAFGGGRPASADDFDAEVAEDAMTF